VRRGTHSEAMSSLQLALAVLQGQGGFGIYPEGTRSRDGRIFRGRTGVAWLALASGSPVVPAGLVGTELVQPVGAARPRVLGVPRITVRFSAPVLPSAYAHLPPALARRRMADDVMDAVGALTGQPPCRDYNAVPPSPTD